MHHVRCVDNQIFKDQSKGELATEGEEVQSNKIDVMKTYFTSKRAQTQIDNQAFVIKEKNQYNVTLHGLLG
jgi:hypothetical protein